MSFWPKKRKTENFLNQISIFSEKKHFFVLLSARQTPIDHWTLFSRHLATIQYKKFLSIKDPVHDIRVLRKAKFWNLNRVSQTDAGLLKSHTHLYRFVSTYSTSLYQKIKFWVGKFLVFCWFRQNLTFQSILNYYHLKGHLMRSSFQKSFACASLV